MEVKHDNPFYVEVREVIGKLPMLLENPADNVDLVKIMGLATPLSGQNCTFIVTHTIKAKGWTESDKFLRPFATRIPLNNERPRRHSIPSRYEPDPAPHYTYTFSIESDPDFFKHSVTGAYDIKITSPAIKFMEEMPLSGKYEIDGHKVEVENWLDTNTVELD